MRWFALLSLLCLVDPSQSQWGPSGPAAVVANPPAYKWIKSQSNPSEYGLFVGNKQIGGFDAENGVYLPIINNQWGAEAKPPITPPEKICTEDDPCFGLLVDKLGGGPRYEINGHEVTKQTAFDAVQKGLPDDTGKLWLTVIGTEEERKRVKEDLDKAPADVKESVTLKLYDPQRWEVKDSGFVLDGKPTIYCQAPQTGKVLHRQDDYNGGADALFTALRKAKPNYDPKKDPDLRQSFLPGGDWGEALRRFIIPLITCVIGACLGVLISKYEFEFKPRG